MRPKTLILMVVAVGCGLAASVLTSRFLSARSQGPAPVEDKIPVLIAVGDIPGYTVIKEEKLFKLEERPKSELPRGPIGEFKRAVGRVLKSPLKAGEPLVENDLAGEDQIGIWAKLKPGERAMSVKVTQITGAYGFIMPGSKVDVIATQTRNQSAQEPAYSKTILQDIEVLAIDAITQAQEGTQSRLVESVTLRLNAEQAQEVALYGTTGELRLLLRNPNDPTVAAVPVTQVGRKAPEVRPSDPNAPTPTGPGFPGTIAPTVPVGQDSRADDSRTHRIDVLLGEKSYKFEYHDKGADGKAKAPKSDKK